MHCVFQAPLLTGCLLEMASGRPEWAGGRPGVCYPVLSAAAVSPPWFQLPAASSSWAPRLVHTVSFLLPLWPQGEWPLLTVAGLWVASPCPTGFSALLTSLSPVVCVKFRLLNHHSVSFVFPSGTPQFGHPQRKWGGAMPSPGRRRPWPGWGPSSS